MKIPLQEFIAGIAEVKAFLSNTERQTALNVRLIARAAILEREEQELLQAVVNQATDTRRYVYIVAIISLYGLFERFIDQIIEEFVHQVVSTVSSYEDIPAKVREHHLRASLDLTKAIIDDRHRSNLKHEDVIANLHHCLSRTVPFQMNGAAFALHRGNINRARVNEYLSSLNIDSYERRMSFAMDFNVLIQQKYPGKVARDLSDEEVVGLVSPLDDLVDRRNEISHGVVNVDEIESVLLLKERCDFLKTYGVSLYYVLCQEYLKYRLRMPGILQLPIPIVVHNKDIVCFEVTGCVISQGETIVAETGYSLEPYRFGQILSLEENRTPVPKVDATSNIKQFGAKVSLRASGKFIYYILPPNIF